MSVCQYIKEKYNSNINLTGVNFRSILKFEYEDLVLDNNKHLFVYRKYDWILFLALY